MAGSWRARRRLGTVASVAVVATAASLVLVGCGSSLVGGSSSDPNTEASSSGPAVITVTPEKSGAAIRADSPIVVSVDNGKLSVVTVTGPGGQLRGSMNPQSSAWTSDAKSLDFASTYDVRAAAVDGTGHSVELARALKTVTPSRVVGARYENSASGDTVGTGTMVRLVFDEPVKNRQQVEKALLVTSSAPIVGAWSWNADQTAVAFRPQTYWPGSDSVTVSANLKGVELSKGAYGDRAYRTSFRTGPAYVITVDSAKHRMDVSVNGKPVKKFPITTGKPGFDTPSGIMPIMAKEGTVVMDSAGIGYGKNSSEYYHVTAYSAMRLTSRGVYIHAAPWSEGSQGYDNVSHGCIGMSISNAAWLYDRVHPGDVVVVKNAGEDIDSGNGITDWNVSWPKWLAASALGAQTFGPTATG